MMTEDEKQLATILDNFARIDVRMNVSMLVHDLMHAELAADPSGRTSNLAETISDLIAAVSRPSEVYEWWFVSPMLGDDLQSLGAIAIDSAYGWIWGRTETGQSLTMDKDLRRVAAALIESTR